MACPMLAGIAALIIADAKNDGEILTPADVRSKIRKIAYDLGEAGMDESFGHGLPIFGHDGSEEPTEPPEEPDEPDGKKKSMPQANCVYWRMFGDFIESVGEELDGGKSMEQAMAAGFRKLRAHKTGINILLAK